jgi:hypothetical protein
MSFTCRAGGTSMGMVAAGLPPPSRFGRQGDVTGRPRRREHALGGRRGVGETGCARRSRLQSTPGVAATGAWCRQLQVKA